MTELSGYVLETLRKGGEFILYRGRQRGNPLAPSRDHPDHAQIRAAQRDVAHAGPPSSTSAALHPPKPSDVLRLTRGRTLRARSGT